jgi:hypothetical protein
LIPKKYFDLLGIKPTHNKHTIKKAYRKLAFKYHPDVNPSKKAHQQFIKITEAYEICLGERIIKQNRVFTPKSKETILKERIERARAFKIKQKEKEAYENLMYFKNLTSGYKWQLMKLLSIISLLLVFLLTVDRLLPKTENIEPVYLNLNKDNLKYVIGGQTYYFDNYLPIHQQNMIVKRTKIFNDVYAVKVIKNDFSTQLIYPKFSIQRQFYIVIVILLIPTFTLLYKRQTVLFTFLYLWSFTVTSFLVLVILLSNHRLYHLLVIMKDFLF